MQWSGIPKPQLMMYFCKLSHSLGIHGVKEFVPDCVVSWAMNMVVSHSCIFPFQRGHLDDNSCSSGGSGGNELPHSGSFPGEVRGASSTIAVSHHNVYMLSFRHMMHWLAVRVCYCCSYIIFVHYDVSAIFSLMGGVLVLVYF